MTIQVGLSALGPSLTCSKKVKLDTKELKFGPARTHLCSMDTGGVKVLDSGSESLSYSHEQSSWTPPSLGECKYPSPIDSDIFVDEGSKQLLDINFREEIDDPRRVTVEKAGMLRSRLQNYDRP